MKVSLARYHGLERWRVTWRANDKTHRRFFPSRKTAEMFAAATALEIRTYGEAWAMLPPRDRAELYECHVAAKEKGYTVAEACRFWEEHGTKTASGITLKDLVTQFLDSKRGKALRPESLRLLETTLDQFLIGRADVRAADLTSVDVRSFLSGKEKWGPWRRRGAIIDLTNLFSWAIRAGLLLHNPAASIERPKIDHKTPAILSLPEC